MRFGRLAAAQTSGTRGTEAFQPGARLASVAQHTQGERLCSILPVDRGSRAGDGCAAGAVRWTADTGGVDDGALSWPCLASVGSGRASVAERRIDCAHQEKVFSVFEEHTRWISKGKAGVAVELGVPVCIVEDQFQFIVHHKILWQGGDVDVAVPMVEETQARFSDFRMCSFDRGFHSPNNRKRLDQMLDVNALPQKGYLSKADQLREQEPGLLAARRQHPAVESAINNLEHRGLERIRSHGADGFERTVALSVLAANLHRIGLLLQRRARERIRRQKKVRLRAA
jgi:hypothetical protein